MHHTALALSHARAQFASTARYRGHDHGTLLEGHKKHERVFRFAGKEPQGVDRPAIYGIIRGSPELAGDVEPKPVLDAALIAAAQAVEHYEITQYGTLIAWAK